MKGFKMKTRVYYDDTDAGGIMYHSNYLKYCERARSDIFFTNNLSPIIDNSHFVVRKMECDFIKAAKFGDIIDIKTKVLEINNASFVLEQIIYVEQTMIFKANVLLVFTNNGKIKRLDKNTKQLIKTLFIQ